VWPSGSGFRQLYPGGEAGLADTNSREDDSAPSESPASSAFTWTRARDFVTSRWFVKGVFFAIFVVSCIQLLRFYQWAKGAGPYVQRPEAVAGLLPVGHFTSFFAWVRGGGWDPYLPAGLVIIIAAFLISWLFRRGFCGWICPVGTVCEASSAAGRKVFGRNYLPPKWIDIGLRSIRYILAGMVVLFLFRVSLAEAVGFRQLPYMWTADIKILLQFVNPVFLIVVGVSLLIMMVIGPFWCRYLCPLGGLYSFVALASPLAVRRDPQTCISCHKCTKSCHAFIDVEASERVWQPECDGCMDCVKVCPVDDCLEAETVGRVRIASWVWPLLVVVLWLFIWGFAKVTGNWNTPIPPEVFQQVIQSGLVEQRTPGGF